MKLLHTLILPAILLLIIPAELSAAASIKIQGEVKEGETFEKLIGKGLFFRLIPTLSGWDIAIGDKNNPKDSFTAVVTPPYRGVNQLYIAGWHFRNSDNTGPNEPGPKLVNVPGEEREFYFVWDHADYETAMDCLQKMLWGYSFSEQQIRDATALHEKLKKGHGFLMIKDLKLNNLQAGQQAGIDLMKFEVELN